VPIDDDRPRYRRTVEFAYQHAFNLLRYVAKDGSEMLVWNSRDGETMSRFDYDGRDYRFRSAQPERSSVLPERADLVFVSYTREQWFEWCRISYEASCKRDPKYKQRTPDLADFLRVAPFDHGMARVITRHQYLDETHEWQGRLGS
jgi:hypothetical protein